jgi:hypothetical protein
MRDGPPHSASTTREPTLTGTGALTVACVYRSGGRLYSERYVENLSRMVARYLSLPHRFVCLSDVDVPCERIPLVTGWPGYFSKLELFRPGLFPGPVLYFDLDTIIHGDIDPLARLAGEVDFGCVSDPLGGHMNSSVQTFRIDCSFVFDRFHKKGFFDRKIRPNLWFALNRVGMGGRLVVGSSFGDQGFTEKCLRKAGIAATHLDRLLPPEFFSTFNFDADAAVRPPGSVCLMMGRPKPHEVHAGWVGQHWRAPAARGAA